MSGSTTWSFTTDALQPAVSSHTPGLGSHWRGRVGGAERDVQRGRAVRHDHLHARPAARGLRSPGLCLTTRTTNTETFTPTAALAYGTTYTATVSGAKDTDGDPMSGSTTWSFTTDRCSRQ